MLHLTSCRHTDLLAPESEMRETARLLERGTVRCYDLKGKHPAFSISEGTRLAAVCAQALRRLTG